MSGAYQIDPVHSSIAFSIQHLGINFVRGRFREFKGTIVFDEKDVARSSVEFAAQAASIDTDVQQRDDHLRGPEFLDVAKYPELSFKSTKIEKKGKAYVCVGILTMRGVSKEISLPFRHTGPITDPWGALRIGVATGITLNRHDYGVAYNKTLETGVPLVGNEVRIEINLEAVKKPAEAATRSD
jgi:polyisoprenoid-binding protein YceI